MNKLDKLIKSILGEFEEKDDRDAIVNDLNECEDLEDTYNVLDNVIMNGIETILIYHISNIMGEGEYIETHLRFVQYRKELHLIMNEE